MKKIFIALFLIIPVITFASEDKLTIISPYVFEYAPPTCISFGGEKTEGKLCWGAGELVFTGNADASAKIFFDVATDPYTALLKALLKQEGL